MEGDAALGAQKKDGMNYAPQGKINHVVEPGEFNVGITALDHGHINGMTNGLIEAGAAKFTSYVFLAIVIAVMRKIGHKVCDELEAE